MKSKGKTCSTLRKASMEQGGTLAKIYEQAQTPGEEHAWQLAACAGKEQFATSAEAKKTARRIAKRKRHPNYAGQNLGQIEAYLCRHCACWHLGRRKSRAKR